MLYIKGIAPLARICNPCTDGLALYKPQWDLIHNPEFTTGLWDGMEDGAAIDNAEYIKNAILLIKTHYFQNKLMKPKFVVPSNLVHAENISIGGIVYRYIDFQLSTVQNDINPRNILEESSDLKIGDCIFINVPSDQLQTLKAYITDTRKGLVIFSSGWDMWRFGSILGVGNYADSRISEYIRQNVQNQPLEESMNVRTRFIQYLSTLTNPVAAVVNSAHNTNATFTDEANYWDQIDDMFISSINVPQAVYVDGSYPTTTAGIDNLGFNVRVAGGKEAGRNILAKIEQGFIFVDKHTPIDIVSHSMGFAYSLGIIETLQNAGYKIGWIYCIAPENAGAGYIPQNLDGIWQYGANEKKGNASVQDIIAPQAEIPNIFDKRSFFPEAKINVLDFPKCVEIHKIKNYGWIFDLTSDGEVVKRNR